MPEQQVSLPPISVPMYDPKTGLATEPWYRYFESLRQRTGGDTDKVETTSEAAATADAKAVTAQGAAEAADEKAQTAIDALEDKVDVAGDTMTGPLTISVEDGLIILDVINNRDDNQGAFIALRKLSGSPANNDQIGGFNVRGTDSNGDDAIYGNFTVRAVSVAGGAHSGRWEFAVRVAGVNQVPLYVGPDGLNMYSTTGDNTVIDSDRHFQLRPYTVATLPAVPIASRPKMIYVSDESGGPVPAYSDGTNWRRVTDGAIVS